MLCGWKSFVLTSQHLLLFDVVRKVVGNYNQASKMLSWIKQVHASSIQSLIEMKWDEPSSVFSYSDFCVDKHAYQYSGIFGGLVHSFPAAAYEPAGATGSGLNLTPPGTMPSGWDVLTSPEGYTYYYNRNTGVSFGAWIVSVNMSSWVLGLGLDFRVLWDIPWGPDCSWRCLHTCTQVTQHLRWVIQFVSMVLNTCYG